MLPSVTERDADQIAAKPLGLNIIQVYTPITDNGRSDMDESYDQSESVRRRCKPEKVTIAVCDLNAKA